MKPDPLIDIIILDWSCPHILRCLAALDADCSDGQRVHLMTNKREVLDACGLMRKLSLRTTFLDENLGFARANNWAVSQSQAEWVVLLNPDAIVRPGWREAMSEVLCDVEDCVACVGSVQLTGRDDDQIDGIGDSYHVSGIARRIGHGRKRSGLDICRLTRAMFSACAAAVAYRRDVYCRAGGFDESFFCYMEDVDLGFRLRLLGHRSTLATRAVVHHVGGASSGGGRSSFAIYHGQRNLVWTFVKNMPGWSLWALLPLHLGANALLMAWHAIHGHGRVVLRAKLDAIRGIGAVFRCRSEVQASRQTAALDILRQMTIWPWV